MVNIERLNEIAKPRNKKAAFKSYLRRKKRVMKDFIKTWQFWAIIAAVVLAVVAVVLYFTVPAIKDILVGFCLGVVLCVGVAGYIWLKKKGVLD